MGKGRTPCCDKSQVKRGPWSPSEDIRLISFVQKHGHDNWRALPKRAGLLRCGKSCRLRWINYLRPDVKRGNYTQEEEDTIIKLHRTLGNRWSKIASYLPGRTDNEIKNVWNTYLKKKLALKTEASTKSPKECSSDSFSSSSCSISHSYGKEEDTIHHGGCITDKSSQEPEKAEMNIYQPNLDDSSSEIHLEHEGSTKQGEMSKPEVEEIPLESDTDFWNMLDGLEPFRSNNFDLQGIEACSGSLKDQGDGQFKWFHWFDNEFSSENQNY